MSDWRSGELIGSGWCLLINGKCIPCSSKDELRKLWDAMCKRIGREEPFPDALVRQVCFITPPWEKS